MKNLKLGSMICTLALIALSTIAAAQEAGSAKITCRDTKSDAFVIRTLEITRQADGQLKAEVFSASGPEQDPAYVHGPQSETKDFFQVQSENATTLIATRKIVTEHGNNSLFGTTANETLTVDLENLTAARRLVIVKPNRFDLFGRAKQDLDNLVTGLASPQGLAQDSSSDYDSCVVEAQ